MKAKVMISIGLCMLLVTGCTSGQKSEDALSIYANLDGKETYEKLVKKTNKEVKYMKNVVMGEQQYGVGNGFCIQNETYQLEDGIGYVAREQTFTDNQKREIQYSVTTNKEKYELSNNGNDAYTVSKSSEETPKQGQIFNGIYTRDDIEVLSMKRKDKNEKIILNAKYEIDDTNSTVYYDEEFVIGKDGLLEKQIVNVYLDKEYERNIFQTKVNIYCKTENKSKDFEKELELIQSLDGASTKEVEEKVVFTTY